MVIVEKMTSIQNGRNHTHFYEKQAKKGIVIAYRGIFKISKWHYSPDSFFHQMAPEIGRKNTIPGSRPTVLDWTQKRDINIEILGLLIFQRK